jgi:NADPH2:quinone reductase
VAGGIGCAQGTIAEYRAADARLIAAKPNAPGMHEAAVMPPVFITACEGLVERVNVRSGKSTR